MDITELASRSGDSQLLTYKFSEGLLQLLVLVPDVSDRPVTVNVPTHCVIAVVPKSAAATHRTCFIELVDVASRVKCSASGIVIPPDDFAAMMRQVSEGLGMAFGSRVSDVPYVLRLMAAGPILSCTVSNIGEISCEMDTQGNHRN